MVAFHCGVDQDRLFKDFARVSGQDEAPTAPPDRSHRITVRFDGWLGNAPELLAEEAGKDPGRPDPSSVEDLLVAIYLRGDFSELARLSGPFALVIWDEEERRLVAASDGIGMKRLHYHLTPQGLVCSSRLADLPRTPGFEREIDAEGFTEYMTFGHVNPPLTIYRGVRTLLPGEFLVYRDGTLDVRQYRRHLPDVWSFNDTEGIPESELVDRLDAHMAAAVRRFSPPERDIAVYLSGGLDTALLCAMYRRHTDRTIHAFTMGTTDPGRDETPYARETARHLGIEDHRTIYLTKDDFVTAIHSLSEIYGQPFADSSAIPTYSIARKVGAEFPSVVAGEGPDGMYGGVDFRLVYWYYKLTPYHLRIPAAHVADRLVRLVTGGAIAPTIHLSELLRQPDFVWIFNKMFKSHELDRLLGRHVPPETFWGHRLLAERKDIPLYERLRVLFQRTFIINDVLHKASAGHDAASVNLLCPYYDRDLYDFVQYLPTRYKTRRSKGKYLHRALLARYLPEEIFHRPKRGFRIGYDEFGLDLLKQLTDTYLTPEAMGEIGLVNVQYARKCVDEFFRGNERMGSPLWALLVFELWRQGSTSS